MTCPHAVEIWHIKEWRDGVLVSQAEHRIGVCTLEKGHAGDHAMLWRDAAPEPSADRPDKQ